MPKNVMINEPTVAIGLRTGKPKFTLGEPTRKYPGGIPEMAHVTPTSAQITPISRLMQQYRRRGVPRAASGAMMSLLADRQARVGSPTGGLISDAGSSNSGPTPASVSGRDARAAARAASRANMWAGDAQADYSNAMQSGDAAQAQQAGGRLTGMGLTPTYTGAFMPAAPTSPLPPSGSQQVSAQPIGAPQPMPGTTSGATPLPVGQLARNIQMGLPPRSLQAMLPSQRSMLEGLLSAIGIHPEDFWQSLQQGYPSAPGATNYGSY